MNTYRLTIEPLSAFRTPLQSDTIFGHLLWALRYTGGQGGEQELVNFVARYRAGDAPLLVSAGFPEDSLPAPALPRPRPKNSSSVANRVVGDLLRKLSEELAYLPRQQWVGLVNKLSGETVRAALHARLTYLEALESEQQQDQEDYRRQQKKEYLTRTAVDRVTGSAREGRLFMAAETFYQPPARFDIWHKLAEGEDIERFKRCWRWIEANGFGKRKSAGAGAFKITRLLEPEDLPQADNPNAFMSLSAWTPAAADPTDATYKTRVKRGKLAEQYALPSPWKKPLLMLEPGAIARLPEGEMLKDWYGRLITDVHWSQENIVQFGLALPLGIKLVLDRNDES